MSDNLDRMRKAAKDGPPPKPPAPPKKAAPPDPKAAKTPERTPPRKYKFRCGHSFTEFDITQHDCVCCHRKNQTARRREAFERKAASAGFVGRLPAGSVKTLTWDEVDGVLAWRGVLTVPGAPHPFRATEKSEERCFHSLHRCYVAWLASQTSPFPSPAT